MPRLAAALFAGSVLVLGLCAWDVTTLTVTAGKRPDPYPGGQLWRIELLEGGKSLSVQDTCTDAAIRAAFAHPPPQVEGQDCKLVGAALAGSPYAVQCADRRTYQVRAEARGDRSKDYTVDLAASAPGKTLRQSYRYQRLGACPPDWLIAETAAPGSWRVSNDPSGTAHEVAIPTPPPGQ